MQLVLTSAQAKGPHLDVPELLDVLQLNDVQILLHQMSMTMDGLLPTAVLSAGPHLCYWQQIHP